MEDKLLSLEGASINEKSQAFLQEKLFSFLLSFSTSIQSWKELSTREIHCAKIFLSKLTALDESLDIAYQMPLDDLCWLDPSHDRWVALQQHLTYHEPENIEKLQKSYRDFIKHIIIGQAFISKGLLEQNKFRRNLMVGLGAMYYSLFKKKAERQALISCANPRIVIAKTTWNLLDSWICTKVMSPLMVGIQENVMVYIPRTAPHLTTGAFQETSTEHSLVPMESYVPMRVLSPYPLISMPPGTFWTSCCGSREPHSPRRSIDLIFHIHGGGFISMSSNSHQAYTRRWANDLNMPVFSVDYRLAPKNPFPDGLDDVWQAYMWVTKYYSVPINKIIVTGDSAGGNMALCLCYKLIIEKARLPDGLMLSYPAVNLDRNTFNRSVLKSLDDNVLPHSFLKLCLESYIRDKRLDPTKEIMLSPILAKKKIMKKLPRVRIITGDNDPLYDDCLKIVEKFADAGVDVKCDVFRGAPHGALSFYTPGGVKESKVFYDKSLENFREMLGLESVIRIRELS